jgi:hypothetical protein
MPTHQNLALSPSQLPRVERPPLPNRKHARAIACALQTLTLYLFVALLPLNVHNLRELEISRVGREQTGGRADARCKADLRVDVEHAGRAAGGPDNGGGVSLVVLEVVAVNGALEDVFGGGL